MCGISGLMGQGWDEFQLTKMIDAQSHRGPNDSGSFIDQDCPVGLGHNRLSIIDLNKSAKCPMVDSTEQFTIVFNGEIYNYIELKNQLSDYKFKTSSDTEVILAAYSKWGEDCVSKFIGMFAFAIWDRNKRTLFCSRDRIGIKPFYFHFQNGLLRFASEIKAILRSGVTAEPDMQQWGVYLSKGYYDHSNKTFFKNIYSLDPGHNLTYDGHSLNIYRYWTLSDNPSTNTASNFKEDLEQLQQLLQESINIHLRTDVPYGINLSSGLDSNLLTTLISKNNTKPPYSTFTASFADKDFDEHAYLLANVDYGYKSVRNITCPSDIPSLAEELIFNQEAPFGGVPTLSYYDLHKTMHKHHIPVSMEGQGMDELFGGYSHAKWYHYADIVKDHGWNSLEASIPNDELNAATLHKVNQILSGKSLIESTDGTIHLNTESLSDDIKSISSDTLEFAQPFDNNLNNLLYRDLMHTKLPRVLRMNDRLSMANGIELRVPFLDHRIVEFAFSLNNNHKIQNGESKFILRQLSKSLISNNISDRAKQPVVTPQTTWLKTDLKEWCESILFSPEFKNRNIFDMTTVSKSFNDFLNQPQTNSFFVWQWINTELWFRSFIDN